MTQEEYREKSFEFSNDHIFMGRIDVMSGVPREGYLESVQLLCEKVCPKKILEVGYGLGISAGVFRDFGVKTHYIIEPNRQVLERADRVGRIFIEEFAGNVHELPETFDLIYNDIFDFTGDRFDRFRFRHKWYAELYRDKAWGKGFPFTSNGKEYWQPLTKNEIYMAFEDTDGRRS